MNSLDAQLLSKELDEFEALLTAISNLRSRNDSERLRELVRLRRELANRVQRLREVGLTAFASAANKAVANDFRLQVSSLQSRTMLHQANWPAISIDKKVIEYADASQIVARANHAFIRWTRTALAQLT